MSKMSEHQSDLLVSELGIEVSRPMFIFNTKKRLYDIATVDNISLEVDNIINKNIIFDTELLSKFCLHHNMILQKNNKNDNMIINQQIRPVIALYIYEALKIIGINFVYINQRYYFFDNTHYRNICYDDLDKKVINNIIKKIKLPASQLNSLSKYTEEFIQRVESMIVDIPEDVTMINFNNGILLIKDNNLKFVNHSPKYFVTHKLNYKYDKKATCFKFLSYLQDVLPDFESQQVLQEYLGYCLTRGKTISKMLLIHGSGNNGKSVLCDVVTALFGRSNISSFSLGELSHKDTVRYEAMDKLINFCPDIESKANLQTDTIKLMSSNEHVMVRQLYGQPFTTKWEPKLIFNVNILPRIENSEGFFRRFLIINFDQKIPENKIDIELASKIINTELAGIMNWVIEGMQRLINNNFKLTNSIKINNALSRFRNDSDTFLLFLLDNGYKPTLLRDKFMRLVDIQKEYKIYCFETGINTIKTRQSIINSLEKEGYNICEDNTGRKGFYFKKE